MNVIHCRIENVVVKGWLIDSMDPSLIANFIHFPTANQVWDFAATTYFNGTDTSQVCDLRQRATRMKQADGSIEKRDGRLICFVFEKKKVY